MLTLNTIDLKQESLLNIFVVFPLVLIVIHVFTVLVTLELLKYEYLIY